MCQVRGGVWFLRAICMCGVCEGWVLRSKLEVDIDCSSVGVHVGCRCVEEFWCMGVFWCLGVCVFAMWSGCSVVLCLVLLLRCVMVVEYVVDC